jgi:hypothetical protein
VKTTIAGYPFDDSVIYTMVDAAQRRPFIAKNGSHAVTMPTGQFCTTKVRRIVKGKIVSVDAKREIMENKPSSSPYALTKEEWIGIDRAVLKAYETASFLIPPGTHICTMLDDEGGVCVGLVQGDERWPEPMIG